MRVGFGYDVHRLVSGRKLIVGGVDIPYDKGLEGHSDADVLTHAIMDALLGAAGMGDIGQHFPDSSRQFKDINSLLLLDNIKRKLETAGYKLINIDCTVVAQAPKLSGHIESMEKRLAEVLKIQQKFINIKATTTEGLGFTGSGEGIAAYAVALIE